MAKVKVLPSLWARIINTGLFPIQRKEICLKNPVEAVKGERIALVHMTSLVVLIVRFRYACTLKIFPTGMIKTSGWIRSEQQHEDATVKAVFSLVTLMKGRV